MKSIIDCDIHNTMPSDETLAKYLPERWRRHLAGFGLRFYYQGAYYPRVYPNAARTDAWPPNGLIPGSDLNFLRAQLLDAWNIEIGLLNPLYLAGEQSSLEYAEALARAAARPGTEQDHLARIEVLNERLQQLGGDFARGHVRHYSFPAYRSRLR